MREVVACDVSKYQVPVDDRYPHKWLIFRCCDGTLHDPRCEQNRYWAQHAYAEGRLLGWTAYVVYRPGKVNDTLAHAAMLPKAGAHIMVDAESWRGAIRGDHSAGLNRLAVGLQHLFPGQIIPGLPRVWGYGNQGDLRTIWPHRSVPVVVAAYGSTKPAVPNMVGWQYTDGSGRWPVPAGRPESTPPFGPCDHNVLYLPDHATPVKPSHLLEGDMFELIRNEKTGAVRAAGVNFWRALERDTPAATAAAISRARTSPLCVGMRDVSDEGMAFLKDFYLGGNA